MNAGLAQAESCCVYVKPEKIMQHMHGIIPKLFYCWADPVAHLLLLKSSMTELLRPHSENLLFGHFSPETSIAEIFLIGSCQVSRSNKYLEIPL